MRLARSPVARRDVASEAPATSHGGAFSGMAMSFRRPPRRTLLALLLRALGRRSPRASCPPAADDARSRAKSVCEAHELQAQKAQEPDLASRSRPSSTSRGRRARRASRTPPPRTRDAPGPSQPIPFSHKHHAGQFQIDCQYCHSGTDRSRAAGVPSVELCMGCHAQFPAEYDELEGIRSLKEHWDEKKPIEWVQIHRLPEYVKFQHQRARARRASRARPATARSRTMRQALPRPRHRSGGRGCCRRRSSRWAGASIATARTARRRTALTCHY